MTPVLFRPLVLCVAALLTACAGTTSAPTTGAGAGAQPHIAVERRGGQCELTLSGDIDQNAVQRLQRALTGMEQQPCKERWLVLNAPHGQIGAAVTVGAMLRNRGFHTRLAPGSECLTSCVLVFAAGRERVLGGTPPLARLGISRVPGDADFASNQCEAEIGRAQALTLTRYLRAMLPAPTAEAVFHVMAQTDCRAHRYWRPAEVVGIGLVTRLE